MSEHFQSDPEILAAGVTDTAAAAGGARSGYRIRESEIERFVSELESEAAERE